jgi:hypothetical protein
MLCVTWQPCATRVKREWEGRNELRAIFQYERGRDRVQKSLKATTNPAMQINEMLPLSLSLSLCLSLSLSLSRNKTAKGTNSTRLLSVRLSVLNSGRLSLSFECFAALFSRNISLRRRKQRHVTFHSHQCGARLVQN